jgi:hypothetical protein
LSNTNPSGIILESSRLGHAMVLSWRSLVYSFASNYFDTTPHSDMPPPLLAVNVAVPTGSPCPCLNSTVDEVCWAAICNAPTVQTKTIAVKNALMMNYDL